MRITSKVSTKFDASTIFIQELDLDKDIFSQKILFDSNIVVFKTDLCHLT